MIFIFFSSGRNFQVILLSLLGQNPYCPPTKNVTALSVSWTGWQQHAGNENNESCTSKCTQILDLLQILEAKNNLLIEGQEKMMKKMEEILEKCSSIDDVNVNNTLYKPLQGFPLKTVEEFKEMESDANRSERKKLYHHLRGIGGTKLREFLYTCMTEIMQDELINKFTWPGGAGAEKFGDTKIVNIIHAAAKKCPLFPGPVNKAELKTELQEVLRSVKQRYRNKIKKNAVQNVQESDEDIGESVNSSEADVDSEYETDG
ncbi:uncharacterized protein [Linepithema humile]|uniref:uncharacterized protein n=1 Tax=Linepithema humile TaxID=83485 RepID=UPI00351DE66A